MFFSCHFQLSMHLFLFLFRSVFRFFSFRSTQKFTFQNPKWPSLPFHHHRWTEWCCRSRRKSHGTWSRIRTSEFRLPTDGKSPYMLSSWYEVNINCTQIFSIASILLFYLSLFRYRSRMFFGSWSSIAQWKKMEIFPSSLSAAFPMTPSLLSLDVSTRPPPPGN